MRGHEQLIAVRRRGVKPAAVHVWCGSDETGWSSGWLERGSSVAWIEVGDGDSLAGLDLRCVVGLPVVVQGDSERRVRGVCEAAAECGAKRVIGDFGGGVLVFPETEHEHAAA